MLTSGTEIEILSVRPYVRLSRSIEMLLYHHAFFSTW